MRYGGLHMSEITVTLPEDVLQRAQVLAEHSGKRVADLLAEAIELSFRPLGGASNGARPVTSWSDEEVLAGVHTDLPPRDDARLSELASSKPWWMSCGKGCGHAEQSLGSPARR